LNRNQSSKLSHDDDDDDLQDSSLLVVPGMLNNAPRTPGESCQVSKIIFKPLFIDLFN
jgi:hypothetical protein